jgi:gamma-glutamylcysteine synthetase
MAYATAVGFDGALLMATNLLAVALCATALTLVGLLRDDEPASAAPECALDDLATQEFVVLRDAVLRADAARATA